MKFFITFLILSFSLNSCAMGRRSLPTNERKEQDKMYWPCEKTDIKENLGKFCSRSCLSRDKKNNCLKWKLTIKDSMNEEDFNFMRNNSMILINERYLQ